MASSSSAMLTREELARKRTLDEARKSGVLPPKVDDEGNMLNPHMPEFMAKAPWYLNQDEGSGLKHQRLAKELEEKPALDAWYKRGKSALVGDKKKRFEKNACKNCGATTHTAKDCMERPRKRGAWKTNKDLASDEVRQEKLKLDYDASRDRWNGFDADVYMKQQMRIHERAEQEKRKEAQRRRDEEFRKKQEHKAQRAADREARRKRKREEKAKRKQAEADKSGASSSSSDDDSDDSDDSDSDSASDEGLRERGDESTMFKVGNKVKASVHNLRIREDTAKYLRNLNPESAFYDPKTRSMRANPNPELDAGEAEYAGDNYVKMSGDAVELAKAQVFVWDADRRKDAVGPDDDSMHLQGNPTQIALAQKQFEERAQKAKELREQALKAKYGESVVASRSADPSVLAAASSEFVEYTPDGRRIRNGGASVAQAGPKYEEDVLEGNHTTVWGSYFDRETMRWGFQCCAQTSKRSYCTGEAGKRAKEAARKHAMHPAQAPDASSDAKPKDDVKATEATVSEKAMEEGDKDSKKRKSTKKSSSTRKHSKKHSKRSRRRRRRSSSGSSADSSSSSDSSDSGSSSDGSARRRRRRRKERKKPKATRGEVTVKEKSTERPSEAEMEAYYRERRRDGDPMQN